MRLRDGNILCGCNEEVICIYDVSYKSLTIQDTELHDKSILDLLNIKDNQFISCSADKTIKIWNY